MAALSDWHTGFFGKLPAHGDFVRSGLPSATMQRWDEAISHALIICRKVLEDRWRHTWLGAPIWRFALPPGMCGLEPLLGICIPSTDKVGRLFPLMIAVTCTGATPRRMVCYGAAWLDAAEVAGRSAIADNLTSGQLKSLIPPPPDFTVTADAGLPYNLQPRPRAGVWWTKGVPLVGAQGLVLDAMPDGATLMAMLDGGNMRS
jgi:type VI secretion system protein ImpM